MPLPASACLPAVPAGAVLQVSFDAWAPTQTSHGGQRFVDLGNCGLFNIQAWTELDIAYDNTWQVDHRPTATSAYTTQWVSDSNFMHDLMHDRDVRVVMTLDYGRKTFFVSFDYGTSVVETPRFGFDTAALPSGVRVYEDTRSGTLGVDYDNLQLAAVSEPGSWLLMAGGLAALGWRARHKR